MPSSLPCSGMRGVGALGVLVVSARELDRAEVLRLVVERRLGVGEAAERMGVTRRQASRLLKAFRTDGIAGLASKRRGRPSNRRHPEAFRSSVMAIVAERYADFGPTLATEKLAERHQIAVGKETLRCWMAADGLWATRTERRRRVQQPRARRERFGELIQIDGSLHWWFEDRGPRCSLLVFIDDATSRLLHLRFCPSESTFDYLQAAKASIDRHGKPLAYYSDKHSIFRTPKRAEKTGGEHNGMTQFGRALAELNVEPKVRASDIICANTPQAKGRVERANRTLQDRLVKELRLEGIATIKDANAFAPRFIEQHNARFAKEPASEIDAHRPLAAHESLDGAMCVKSERTVSASLTIIYDRVLFLLEPSDVTADLPRKRVTVCDYPDGRLEIEWRGVALPHQRFDKLQRVQRAPIVENKRLGSTLDLIAQQQGEREAAGRLRRSSKTPRRRGQNGHGFDVPAAAALRKHPA